jgi:hypothetical protein
VVAGTCSLQFSRLQVRDDKDSKHRVLSAGTGTASLRGRLSHPHNERQYDISLSAIERGIYMASVIS